MSKLKLSAPSLSEKLDRLVVLVGRLVELLEQREAAPPGLLLTKDEVAAMLNASADTVDRLRTTGKLPEPIRVGSMLRWRRHDVQRWLDAGCPVIVRPGRRTRSS